MGWEQHTQGPMFTQNSEKKKFLEKPWQKPECRELPEIKVCFMIIHAELHQIYVQDSDKIHNVLEYEGSQWSCQRKQIWAEDAQGVERHSQRKFGSSFVNLSFKNLDFNLFLQAIRAPIVWNRPTTGLFDYHYDVAGLYYQVMLILIIPGGSPRTCLARWPSGSRWTPPWRGSTP